MRSRVSLILLLGLAMGCGSSEEVFAGELTATVVRVEVFNHPDADLRSIARESIVALIPTSWIERGPDGTYAPAPSVPSLGVQHGLCPDELFVDQPVAAVCSGVLIDDDLVLTAGHCIDSRMPCDRYAYVFNYHLDDPTHLAVIRDEDVYSCARVVSEGMPVRGDYTPDFAVVQLDRPVEGAHVPALVRPATPLDQGESLAMIGFGSGLPAKIDTGGSVADPRAEHLDYFVANVDAFQGHSGSATFDSENRLAGILIGGRTPDYVTLEGESCKRVAVHPDSPADELIHNIAPIVTQLCDDGWDADELCGPKACEGQPCGSVLPPPAGGGVVPTDTSGCSTSTGSTGFPTGVLGLLLFAVARRFRRRAA
jgi:MYXO-CTERM domain-containing protein